MCSRPRTGRPSPSMLCELQQSEDDNLRDCNLPLHVVVWPVAVVPLTCELPAGCNQALVAMHSDVIKHQPINRHGFVILLLPLFASHHTLSLTYSTTSCPSSSTTVFAAMVISTTVQAFPLLAQIKDNSGLPWGCSIQPLISTIPISLPNEVGWLHASSMSRHSPCDTQRLRVVHESN
jgi:hypothetical protein